MKEETLSNPEASETPSGEQVASDALFDAVGKIVELHTFRVSLVGTLNFRKGFGFTITTESGYAEFDACDVRELRKKESIARPKRDVIFLKSPTSNTERTERETKK